MADKGENQNSSAPAGGERRAALRSDEVGGGSTRVRESNFPMRRASTLPDVSAYTSSPKPSASEDAEASATTPDTTANQQGSDHQPQTAASTITTVIVDEPADTDGSHGERAGDPPTADPSTPATQQIAATEAGRTGATPAYTGSSRAQPSNRNDDDANPDTSSLSIRPPEEDVNRRASRRDEAAAAKPVLPRVLQAAVAVFFPVILLAAAVRAVTTPLFLWIEYHRPGFPSDSYGFSTEDRMVYGSYTMDYILNWAPARYLGDLVTAEGDQLFLDSEVGHMADVKAVLSTGFLVAAVLAILSVIACIYLARRYPGGIRRALFAGAVATLVLAIVLAVAGILAWEAFFTQVHALFFADGTWTFRLDDTLIRLFPAQFWIDAAGAVGAIVLIGSVLTLVFTWPTRARREKSARAYAKRRANSGI